MGKNILKYGRTTESSATSVKVHAGTKKLFNFIDSPVLNRIHTDLKLKEEIESIERKWRRR